MRLKAATLALLTIALAGALAQRAAADPYFEGRLRHRPRLTFDGRDGAHVQRVVGHLAAQEAPWRGAYVAIRNLAETGQAVRHSAHNWSGQSDPYNVLYAQEAQNGRIARAKAAAAWLYAQGLNPGWRPIPGADPAAWARQQAEEAAEIIAGMYDDWPCWRGFDVINRGIVAASSLQAHAEAYDLLAALPAHLRPGLGGAESRLGALATDFSFWIFTVDAQDNNHTLRVAAGLGTAAIGINRYDRYRWWNPGTWYSRPKDWAQKAERRLHPTHWRSDLRYQTSAGCYAEGTSYYLYAADCYMPFMFGYTRFRSGGGVPFLRSSQVSGAARWCVDLRLPDGRRPVVDNARASWDHYPAYFLSRIPGGARSADDQAAFLWDLEQTGHPGFNGSHALGLLAAYDPSPAVEAQAAQLSGPRPQATLILDREGEAVLRTGWAPDDSYALVVAEHGDARRHGRGHEAVDNAAFTYYSHEDFVTIDPGYGGWSEVDRTNAAHHRSMVLVEGKGPKTPGKWLGIFDFRSRGADADIQGGARTSADPAAPRVEVETEYEGARIRRTAVLVGKRYLLVEDRCRMKRNRRRTFTTQVHTNAGAAKSRPLARSGDSFTYETNRRRVPTAVGAAATASLSARVRSEYDAFGEAPRGHDVIDYSARGREVTFLTAVAANAPGQATPGVSPIAVAGAAVLRVEAGGRVDVAIANPDGRSLQIPATSGTRAITTRAEMAIVSFPVGGGHEVVLVVGSGPPTVN